MKDRATTQVEVALKMVQQEGFSKIEKAEMLMEIAMGLQQKPKRKDDLVASISLYQEAITMCPRELTLQLARIKSRFATALLSMPSENSEYLEQARDILYQVIMVFKEEQETLANELAEAEMNLGLVLHNLVNFGKAKIQDAISAYQRSLAVFDKQSFPKEYAILQNNLATAFLSIGFQQNHKLGEALAVQAFEEGIKVVDIINHPSEYAMLQNNLGNALQYVSSSHRVENGFRALEAYDEALKVRNIKDTPAEYANTISNKANCLINLPDDIEHPELGNLENIKQAKALYDEALMIFTELGEHSKVEVIKGALKSIVN